MISKSEVPSPQACTHIHFLDNNSSDSPVGCCSQIICMSGFQSHHHLYIFIHHNLRYRNFVYVIYSEKLDKYYIGFTADIQDRLAKHNRKSNGFSSRGRPWVLVYSESFNSKREAMDRETQLKNWKNRERLEKLIKVGSEHPD